MRQRGDAAVSLLNTPNPFRLAANIFAPPEDDDSWDPQPHQVPPESLVTGDAYCWLMLAGRGAGKSYAGGRYVNRWAMRNPGARISIIAPTLGDARLSCIEGPSGLKQANPDIKVVKSPDYEVRWPNGTVAHIFGAHTPEDVERLRAGGNRHLVWAEELAAWRLLQPAWDQMQFGLRMGIHPHIVATTTPKNRPLIKKLVKDEKVAITRASTNDNPYLHEHVRDALYNRYAGTDLGRQELDGEIVDDNKNALWMRTRIEELRLTDDALKTSRLRKVVIAVDPAVTANETSDDTGIVAVALVDRCACGGRDHAYVLDDWTVSGATPEGWASRVVAAYEEFEADRVIGEVNNGGDLVESVLRGQDKNLPYTSVRASRGKTRRAEPVAALYEQGKVHHIGGLPELEDQMCTWDPTLGDNQPSPDRMDAAVWGLSWLMLKGRKRIETAMAPATVESGSYWRGVG